jgi:hypothetical protein
MFSPMASRIRRVCAEGFDGAVALALTTPKPAKDFGPINRGQSAPFAVEFTGLAREFEHNGGIDGSRYQL